MERTPIKLNKILTGVYVIECIPTGLIYVGSSVNIRNRWEQHINSLDRDTHENSYLQRAWNKYGQENFTFSVLELCKKSDITEIEQKYLDFYKCYERDKGYNIVPIAYTAPMTEESRKRQSESLKKNTEFIEKSRNFMKELHSDPVKHQKLINSVRNSEKVKKNLKKLNESEEHKKQVQELLNTIHNDPRIQAHVKSMANTNRLDYNWRKLHGVKNVAQFNINGEFVEIFRSLGEIQNTTSFDRGCVSSACKSGKTYRGYLWKFIEDEDYDEFCKLHSKGDE